MATGVIFKLAMEGGQVVSSELDRVRASMGKLQSAGQTVGSALASIGVGLSVGAVVAFTAKVIDSVDALNDLKDATGASIENISALEDIARRTGSSFDTVSTALIKMNQGLNSAKPGSDAANAFKALGLSVAELKAQDPAEAMRVTAMALAGFADDGNKARLTQELFGKSLKEVAPLLKDLAEKGELVATVTTAQAEEAEKFNKELFAMQKNATDLSRALVGPVVTALNEVIQKFKEGRAAGKGFFQTGWQNYKDGIGDFYGVKKNEGGATGSWDSGASGSWPAPKPSVGDLPDTAKIKAAADAAKKAREELRKLVESGKELASSLLQQDGGLSGDFLKKWDSLSLAYGHGAIQIDTLLKAQAQLLEQQPAMKAAAEAQIKAVTKAQEEALKQTAHYYDGLAKGLDTQAEANQKLREHNQEIGLSTEALGQLRLARMDAAIAQEQEIMTMASAHEANAGELRMMQKRIDLLKEERSLTSTGQAKTATNEIVEAQKKAYADMWASVDSTAHDVFVSVANEGMDAFKRIGQTLKSAVLDMLYQMTVKKWIFGIAGSMGGAGLASASGMVSQGSSLLSGLSTASSMATLGSAIGTGIAGTVGSSIGAVFGTVAGNTATGVALGLGGGSSVAAASAASVAGGGAAAGGITTALAAIPVWGWAALAAIAVVSIFGGKGKKEATGGGIEGNFSTSGFEGNTFATWKQKGGWFSGDRTGKDAGALDAATAQQFAKSYGALQLATASAATSLGLSAQALVGHSEKISLQLTKDAAANEKAVAEMFGGIGDRMANAVAPGLAALAKGGETAGATLGRLSSSLTTANAWLSVLRQRLFQVSLAGGDAASKLADAFGGLENLTNASKAFYETYYTEGERAARSQEDMTKALALVNLALPTSKDALRELADTLDLNTDSGRTAYAVLLTIAPEFANTANALAKLSDETAAALMQTFTAGGQLLPALEAAQLKIGDFTGATTVMAGELSYINSIMGDSTSAVIGFSDGAYVLGTSLSDSQLSAGLLNDQIVALQDNTGKARIDFAGLAEALATVDTGAFAATLALVFESLAARISGVINDIGTERIAVRDAALQIINPTVMGKAQIQAGIDGINTGLPGNSGVQSAQTTLGQADALVAAEQARLDRATALLPNKAALDAAVTALAAIQRTEPSRDSYTTAATDAYYAPGTGWYNSEMIPAQAASFDQAGYDAAVVAAEQGAELLRVQAAAVVGVQQTLYTAATTVGGAAVASAQAALDVAQTQSAAASTAAKKAVLDYGTALQDFAIDASKSVGKLSRLREETVKYYEAQKQLADLMGASASGLRATVGAYRYGQMSDAQQFDKLQGDFAKNYALALSTDGSTLASYGDKLNAGLNPLLEKAREVLSGDAYNAFAATALARADAIAGRLETLTPTNYAADSLTMLGSIDATLVALDASSQSAEKIIADAIRAGSDRTAAGLGAIVRQLGGAPAFASGGSHAGGLRKVGENGPEWEVTGPSLIFNQSQTRRSGGGGTGDNADVVAELRALRADNANMRAELRAIAVAVTKTAKQGDRVTPGNDAIQVRVVT